MATDLTPAAQIIPVLDPSTGELVPLDAPTDRLAEVMWNIRELEGRLRSEKQRLADEFHRRMDPEGLWTVRVSGWEVKGEAPGKVEYDPEKLKEALSDLVDREVITARAADEACELVMTWKPKARGINALKKLGGEVADAIEGCEKPLERPRRVSVKPENPRG